MIVRGSITCGRSILARYLHGWRRQCFLVVCRILDSGSEHRTSDEAVTPRH